MADSASPQLKTKLELNLVDRFYHSLPITVLHKRAHCFICISQCSLLTIISSEVLSASPFTLGSVARRSPRVRVNEPPVHSTRPDSAMTDDLTDDD